MLAENTLLKTAYHFLLLLVGFDTLTYRKDYDRSPILVVHQYELYFYFGVVLLCPPCRASVRDSRRRVLQYVHDSLIVGW